MFSFLVISYSMEIKYFYKLKEFQIVLFALEF